MDDYQKEHEKWFQEIAERAGYVDFPAAVRHVRRKAPSRYPKLGSLSNGEIYALRRYLGSVGDRQGKDKGTLDARRYVTILWDDTVARGLGICKMVEEMFGVHAYLTPYIIWGTNSTGPYRFFLKERILKVVVMFREEKATEHLKSAILDGARLSNGYALFQQMLTMGG